MTDTQIIKYKILDLLPFWETGSSALLNRHLWSLIRQNDLRKDGSGPSTGSMMYIIQTANSWLYIGWFFNSVWQPGIFTCIVVMFTRYPSAISSRTVINFRLNVNVSLRKSTVIPPCKFSLMWRVYYILSRKCGRKINFVLWILKYPPSPTKDCVYLTTYTIWCLEMISNLSNVFVSTTRSMIIIVKTSHFTFYRLIRPFGLSRIIKFIIIF